MGDINLVANNNTELAEIVYRITQLPVNRRKEFKSYLDSLEKQDDSLLALLVPKEDP